MGSGWWYCGSCEDKFTVRVGTVFERSHIPLHKWLLAFRLMTSSKRGCSAHQLHRTLGITYKSAWFLRHRIREVMALESNPPQLGGEGKVIEADETLIGRAGSHDRDSWIFGNGKGWVRKGGDQKMKVMTPVERGGSARSLHVDRLTAAKVCETLVLNARCESVLNTDETGYYATPGRRFAKHETVVHSKGNTSAAIPTRTRSKAIARSSSAA
jgi:hypothetical protein